MRPLKKKSRTETVLAWVFTFLLIAGIAFLMYQAITIQIFSDLQLIAAGLVLTILAVLLIWWLFSHVRLGWKILAMILSAALSAGCCMGGWYLSETSSFFALIGAGSEEDEENQVDDELLNQANVLSEKVAMTVTTYAMSTTGYTKPSDLSGKVIGIIPEQDEEGTEGALSQLKSSGMRNAETKEYANAFLLVDALYNDEVDAIVLPEQFHGDLLDAANDINKYNALTTFTNTVDQYIYYEPIPEEMKNEADPVKDITKDAFVVLISGSDSYGNLASKSRSDVNMLAAVNPETAEVLLISIPRDAYMEFSCNKNEEACGPAAGQMDKLTHSGIYGIGTTESSIEDFLDIEINYTVRVNFSSLINVVDAIGGINVMVEEGLEVDTFYSNGTEGVKAGLNHLDGERALAFARERHAYLDGDNQRVKNQQIVLKAILQQMMSPSMIIKYPAFIRALSTAFSTNMPSRQIRDLIKLEVSSFPSWNIQSYALSGSSATRYCAALGSAASVSLIDEGEIEEAHDLIKALRAGKEVEVPEETSKSSTYRDSGEDSESELPYDDAGFDQVPIEQLPGYYDPYSYPSYNNDPVFNETPVYPQPAESTVEIPVQDPYVPDDVQNGFTSVQPGLGDDSYFEDAAGGGEDIPMVQSDSAKE